MEKNLFDGKLSYEVYNFNFENDKPYLNYVCLNENVPFSFFTKLDFLFKKEDLFFYATKINSSLFKYSIFHFYVEFDDNLFIDLGYGGYFNYEKKEAF